MHHSKQFGHRQGITRPSTLNTPARTLRWGSAIILGGALLMPVLVGGCNKMESSADQADRVVKADIDKSEADRQSATKDADQKALADLRSATATVDASNGAKASANSLLGQAEYQAAWQNMLTLQRDQISAQRVLWEIQGLGAQIGQKNGAVNRYKLNDPKAILEELKKQQADLAQKQLEANQRISALNAEMQKRQAEIKQMESDKAAADTQSETLLEKAAAAKGNEQVKLYTQGQQARQTSGTLDAKLAEAKAALQPIQHDIDLATMQVKMATDASKNADAQKQQIAAGWTDLSAQISTQQDAARKLASDQLTAKAKEFKSLVAASDTARGEADKNLKSALDHYKIAVKATKLYYSYLDGLIHNDKFVNLPEQSAWKDLLTIYADTNYIFDEGLTQQAQGNLYGSYRAALMERERVLGDLKVQLDQAGAAWPEELGDLKLDSQITQATTDAKAAYDAAATSFETVSSPANSARTSKNLREAAQKNNALVAYGEYQIETNEAQKAKALAAARSLAMSANVRLPNEAPEITGAPAPTPPPSSAPSAAPETAPAEGSPATPAAP